MSHQSVIQARSEVVHIRRDEDWVFHLLTIGPHVLTTALRCDMYGMDAQTYGSWFCERFTEAFTAAANLRPRVFSCDGSPEWQEAVCRAVYDAYGSLAEGGVEVLSLDGVPQDVQAELEAVVGGDSGDPLRSN